MREKIKEAKLFIRDNPLPPITISVGIAEFPIHGGDMAEIIRAADDALYQAKKAGRDRIEISRGNNPSDLN